jgi:hypothetical protein
VNSELAYNALCRIALHVADWGEHALYNKIGQRITTCRYRKLRDPTERAR